MSRKKTDDMEIENLLFSVDTLKLTDNSEKINSKNANLDSYYVRYKLGISETDLDSMCPQEKLDFCDYISKWRWGTSGSFFIGISSNNTPEKQLSITDIEKDIGYLSKMFPYKIIVYFAGESSYDYCSKVFSAGTCEKFISLPAFEINKLLHVYNMDLRPLEIFYRDPEFVDLDAIDICDF